MLLTNPDVFPDDDFTADEMDQAKVERVKATAVLATLGRIVRSDFFKLVPFNEVEKQMAAARNSDHWKEWKLYLATMQGPMACNSWRYDTLCDPRYKEEEEKFEKKRKEEKKEKEAKEKEKEKEKKEKEATKDSEKGGSSESPQELSKE